MDNRVQGNTEAEACQLSETERGHRLQANEYMEAIGEENHGIYVAGDVSGYIVPENGRPTPQIVEAAEQTGSTAAKISLQILKVAKKPNLLEIIVEHWFLLVQAMRLGQLEKQN